jgi:putative peptide zinc metalloprotease protein
VVESGVIAMPDGVELRRGTLVGPVGDGSPGMVAQTLTPVRLWVLPDASDIPPLVGAAHRPGSPMPVGALRPGAPAPDAYPPLAVPPGPPEGPDNQSLDRRFEGRLWWFTVLLLALALVLVGLSFRPGPAWAEMPRDQVLLTVDRGHTNATVDGAVTTFAPGDDQYLGQGAQVEVPADSTARITFPGGGATVLCAGARVQIGALAVHDGRHQAPRGTLSLQAGRVLADTTGTSGAFLPLGLTVTRASGDVINSGAAWYAVDPGAVTVSTGKVSVGGAASKATGKQLTCGDGVAVTPPSTEGNTPSEEPSPTDTGSPLPTDSASVGPAASETSATATTAPAETTNPTGATTTPTTAATTTKPPATTRPTVSTKTPTATPTTGSTTTPTTTPTTAPTTSPTSTDSASTPESSGAEPSGTP